MATGSVELDFGPHPGKTDVAQAVASATIATGSLLEAWVRPVATADHSADEHMVEGLKVVAGTIVAGVGFTLYGFATGIGAHTAENTNAQKVYGKWTIGWAWV